MAPAVTVALITAGSAVVVALIKSVTKIVIVQITRKKRC